MMLGYKNHREGVEEVAGIIELFVSHLLAKRWHRTSQSFQLDHQQSFVKHEKRKKEPTVLLRKQTRQDMN